MEIWCAFPFFLVAPPKKGLFNMESLFLLDYRIEDGGKKTKG